MGLYLLGNLINIGMAFAVSNSNPGHVISQLIFCIYMSSKREALRKKLGGTGSDGCSGFKDGFLYWWCSCCMGVQDARQIDKATNTRTSCCFKFEQKPGGTVVGPATVIGQN